MLKHLIQTYDLQLNIAKGLVKDIPDEQMCAQPSGLVNHPTWTLGHLVMSADGAGELIGAQPGAPENWKELFKTGGTPSGDPAGQPSKAELLTELEAVHDRWKAVLPGVSAEALDAEHPNEKTRAYFPTVGAMVTFLMTSHEMDHLGQVAAWRRAQGLGPVQQG